MRARMIPALVVLCVVTITTSTTVPSAHAGIFDKIKKAFKKAGKKIKGAAKNLKDRIEKAPARAKEFFEKAADTVKALGGSVLKLLGEMKNLAECMAKRGASGIFQMFKRFKDNPASFLKSMVSDLFSLVKIPVVALLSKGGEALETVLSSLTGTKISDEALNGFLDFAFTQMRAMAKHSRMLQCLVDFAGKHEKLIRKGAKFVVQTFLNTWSGLYASHIEPRLGAIIGKLLEKLFVALIGEKLTDRVKMIAARVFDPTRQAKIWAEKLRLFIVALNAKAPNAKALWGDVKAAMGWNPDFGARLVIDVVKETVKVLVEMLIDKVADQLIDWLNKAISSVGVGLVNLTVNMVCGLSTWLGTIGCEPGISRVIRVAWDFIGSTLTKFLGSKLVKVVVTSLAPPIVKAISDAVFNKLGNVVTRIVTKPIDAAVSKFSVVGIAARIAAPVIDIIYRAVVKWVRPDDKDGLGDLQTRVLELGDKALDLATGGK